MNTITGSGSSRRRFGVDDVQRQAVLAHRLVLADAEQRVHALLRRAVGEPVAVPHARPRLHRLRRAEPQTPHRRLRERNRPPAVHAVAGEPLDGARADGCADDVFVHQTDRIERNSPPAPRRLSADRPASLAGMRIAVLIAASVLVGGCSQGVGGNAEKTEPSPSAPTRTTIVNAAHDDTDHHDHRPRARTGCADRRRDRVRSRRVAPPRPASYHSATRDGATTQLGDDVAFTTPSGKSNCMTDSKNFGGALACLVDLTDPPAAAGRRVRPVEGWLGRLRRAERRRRLGAWRSGPIQQRHRARSWRTATPWRSATTGAGQTPRACSASTTRTSRPRGSATRASSRSAVCRRSPPPPRHRREVQLLNGFGYATPFWRSSGSTPSANQ